MAGFKIRVLTAGPHIVGDLGIVLDSAGAAPLTEDHTSLPPQDVARSADLLALIGSLDIAIVDARDDSDATILDATDSAEAVSNHNDTHFGISGGRFNDADDPTNVSLMDGMVLEYDSASDQWAPYPHEHLFAGQNLTLGEIIGGMGIDGTDTTFTYTATSTCLVGQGIQDETYYDGDSDFFNGTFSGGAGFVGGDVGLTIVLADGSTLTIDAVAAGAVTDFTVTTSGETVVTTGVPIAQTGGTSGGAGFTLTPEQRNVTPGKIEWSVNDVFLRNTGDTLDSGTLTIASGAAVDFPTGSSLTIAGDVTAATIITPAGGFTGGTDLINKDYVDSLAGGFDYKESVRVATTPTNGDLSGTFVDNGGVGDTLTYDSTAEDIDGLVFADFSVGDRVLVKNQTTPSENGIYTVTAGSIATAVILTRATDQDGSPSSEVSGGNTVFVEDTTAINASSVNSNTRWSVVFDGEIVVNTDPINWTQTGGDGSTTDGIGISRDGNTLDLDVDDLVAATPVAADLIAFHDLDGVAEASGSQTRKVTFTDLFNALDVVNGISANGFIVRTADDTYASRTIVVNGAGNLDGLAITDGDGIAGNPTIGLDIQNLPARSTAIDTTDRVAVWRADGTDANEYYTVAEIAGAVSASDSFATWARSTASGGGGSGGPLVADSSADTVTLDAGIGIDLDMVAGTDTVTFSFTNSGMADTAVVGADTVPFFDADNSDEPEFRSWTDIISDLGLQTSSNTNAYQSITGGDGGTATAVGFDTITFNGTGINITASDAGAGADTLAFVLDISDLADGNPGTIVTGDEIAVNDGGTTVRYSWADVIADLGLLTSSATFFWSTIDISGGNTTGDGSVSPATASDTLNLSAGVGLNLDGSDATDTIVATFGRFGMVDTAVTTADTVPFFDATNSNDPEFRSWADIITDLGLQTNGNTSYWGSINTSGNTAGDTTPAADPDTADDTLTFNGGIGITLTGTAAADTISWAFTRAGMADTATALTDTFPFFDGSNSNEPEFRSFSDAFNDLDVVHNIGSGTGIVVKTGDSPDTYTTRSIVESTTAGQEGAQVNDGDGSAGDIEIGVDIDNLANSGDDLAATDEAIIFDGTNNVSMTGQQIADGVAAILDIDTLSFSTINGQEILTFADPNRVPKVLSIDSNSYTYSDNTLDDGSWVEIGNAIDVDAGHIMPFQGTIVGITAMSENPNGSTYDLDLFINGALSTSGIATLTGTGIDTDVDMTLNIDFAQGDRLRLQASRTAGATVMQDTVVNLIVRWRA